MTETGPETREELIQHLEKLTAKKITLIVLLGFGVMQYYILRRARHC